MDCPPGGSCSIPGAAPVGRVGSFTGTSGSGAPAQPSVPPRPNTNATSTYRPQYPYPSTLGYGSSYYGSMSPYYGGYSGSYGYGGGYGAGYGSTAGNGLGSDMEQTWRQAFASIESVVRTCSSVTMMLDSTYFAVFNCFRTVVGLGEHFSGLKAQLGRVLHSFPFIRWALRLVRFLLRIVGLQHLMPQHLAAMLEENVQTTLGDPSQAAFADAWATSTGTNLPALPAHEQSSTSSLWSLTYFAIVFGLPWLLWKLMSSSVQKQLAQRQWFSSGQPHPVAVAQFDFQSDRSEELSFLRGSKIHLAPLEGQPHAKSGWLLATIDGKTFGLVPKNYLSPPTLSSSNPKNSNLNSNNFNLLGENSDSMPKGATFPSPGGFEELPFGPTVAEYFEHRQ